MIELKLITIVFIIININLSCGEKIPGSILKCYNRTEYPSMNESPPLNVRLLVELLRKIEFNEILSTNIRILSSMLYESVQLDGIQLSRDLQSNEHLIPYSNTGNSYFKYKFLKQFIPGRHELPNDTLTLYDFCTLHKIISETLDVNIRGDESNTCPTRKPIQNVGSYETSSCPIEKGVLHSRWGTISSSNVLNGIAAEYVKTVEPLSRLIQPNDTDKINKALYETYLNTNLNNVWIATVLTDLAETLLYQVDRINIANVAKWNDTIMPRLHYLTEYDWTMSASELLGGIDGLILSSEIQIWTKRLSSTRLSQIIDMYYSDRGVAFDGTFRACNRKSKISQLFDGIDLGEQIATTALLLRNSVTYSLVLDKGIQAYAKYVAEAYTKKRDEILEKFDPCKEDYEKRITKVILTVVFDGSLDFYQSQRIISYLTDVFDVSHYGSKLGIINGQNGKFIVNVTNSITEIFSNLTTYDISQWPNHISLTDSLTTIKLYYDKMFAENNSQIRRPFGYAAIIFLRDPLSDSERDGALNVLSDIKEAYPELYLIYVTGNGNKLPVGTNELTISIDDFGRSIDSKAVDNIRTIPMHLLTHTTDNFEDYVTPNMTNIYEVNKKYLKRGDVNVKFSNHEYGTFVVCLYEEKANGGVKCNKIDANGEIEFKLNDFCSDDNDCTMRLELTTNSTLYKCSEPDCRYPDQVRVTIQSRWATRSGSSTVLHTLLLFVVNMIFTFMMK